MKKLVRRKYITVRNHSFIGPLQVDGPLEHKTLVDVETIRTLVMQGYRVFEVLQDDTSVPLDASNYDLDNSKDGSSVITTYESNFPVGHRIDKTVESIPAPLEKSELEMLLQRSTHRRPPKAPYSPLVDKDFADAAKPTDVSASSEIKAYTNEGSVDTNNTNRKNRNKKADKYEKK